MDEEDLVTEQAPSDSGESNYSSGSSDQGGDYSSDSSDQGEEEARRRQEEAEQEARQSEENAQPQKTKGEGYNPEDEQTDQDYSPRPIPTDTGEEEAKPIPLATGQPKAQPVGGEDSNFPDPWAAPTGGAQDLEDSVPVAKSQMQQLFQDIMAYTRERFNLHHHAGNQGDNSKGPAEQSGYYPPSEASRGPDDGPIPRPHDTSEEVTPDYGYDPGMTPTERAARATAAPGGETSTAPNTGLDELGGKVSEFLRPGFSRGPDDKGGTLAQAGKAGAAMIPRIAQYLMGHGAMDPQEAASHEQRLAPNAVSTGDKKAETLAGLAAEDKNKASDYVLMNKSQHQNIQAGAWAALEHGDIGSAARMATEAHHHLFDGNDLIFRPSADGNGVSAIVVGENGDTKRYDLTQDGFGHFLHDAQSGHYDQLADRGVHDVLREASQVGVPTAAVPSAEAVQAAQTSVTEPPQPPEPAGPPPANPVRTIAGEVPPEELAQRGGGSPQQQPPGRGGGNQQQQQQQQPRGSGGGNWGKFLKGLSFLESNGNPHEGNRISSAQGAFQFLRGTAAEAMRMGLPDPRQGSYADQAAATKAYIERTNPRAAAAIQRGDYDSAHRLLNRTWPSLPGGSQPQMGSRMRQYASIIGGGGGDGGGGGRRGPYTYVGRAGEVNEPGRDMDPNTPMYRNRDYYGYAGVGEDYGGPAVPLKVGRGENSFDGIDARSSRYAAGDDQAFGSRYGNDVYYPGQYGGQGGGKGQRSSGGGSRGGGRRSAGGPPADDEGQGDGYSAAPPRSRNVADQGRVPEGYPASYRGPGYVPSSTETVGDENQPYHYRDPIVNNSGRYGYMPRGLSEAERAEYMFGPGVKLVNGVPIDHQGNIISPTPGETVITNSRYNAQAIRERQALRAAGWGGGGAEHAIVPPGEHLPLVPGDRRNYPRAGAIPEFDPTTGNPDIMAGQGATQAQGRQGDQFDQQAKRDLPWASQSRQQGPYAQTLRQQDQKNQIDMTRAQGVATRGQSTVEAAKIRAGASVYGTDQRRDAAKSKAQTASEAVAQRRESAQIQAGWRDRGTQQRIDEMIQRHQDKSLDRESKLITNTIAGGGELTPEMTTRMKSIMDLANQEAKNPGSTGVQPQGRAPAAPAPAPVPAGPPGEIRYNSKGEAFILRNGKAVRYQAQ